MMLLVLLTVSATLLGTIQGHGDTCDKTCELLPWQEWGSCSGYGCSGYHTRGRHTCCILHPDVDNCLRSCGHTSSDLSQTEKCSCDDGCYKSYSSYICSCNPGSYGECCQ
ncbi:hypothetical protein LSAT2_027441, partial [Lamellibrachia satsuma]